MDGEANCKHGGKVAVLRLALPASQSPHDMQCWPALCSTISCNWRAMQLCQVPPFHFTFLDEFLDCRRTCGNISARGLNDSDFLQVRRPFMMNHGTFFLLKYSKCFNEVSRTLKTIFFNFIFSIVNALVLQSS